VEDPEPASQALQAALDSLPPGPCASVDDLMSSLTRLAGLITAFFDQVLVMDPDEALRRSRLALAGRVAALARGVADLSRLEGF
jgi:glycyl-tRNA synthetase beta subunit